MKDEFCEEQEECNNNLSQAGVSAQQSSVLLQS